MLFLIVMNLFNYFFNNKKEKTKKIEEKISFRKNLNLLKRATLTN